MSGRLHDVVGRPLGRLVARGWNAISDQKINPNLNLFTWSGNTAIVQVTATILTMVALFAASAALGKVTRRPLGGGRVATGTEGAGGLEQSAEMAAKAKYAKALRRGTGFGGSTWIEMMLGELVEKVCFDTLPGIIAKRLGDHVDSLWWYQLGHILDDVSPSMFIGFDIEGGKPQIDTIAHRVVNLYNARVEYTKAMTEANIQMQFKRLERVSSPEVQLQEQVRVLTDAVTGKNLFKYSLFTGWGFNGFVIMAQFLVYSAPALHSLGVGEYALFF